MVWHVPVLPVIIRHMWETVHAILPGVYVEIDCCIPIIMFTRILTDQYMNSYVSVEKTATLQYLLPPGSEVTRYAIYADTSLQVL